jgi:hypothetical protein
MRILRRLLADYIYLLRGRLAGRFVVKVAKVLKVAPFLGCGGDVNKFAK